MQLNGSQIFVEVLCEQGVDTLFGYPGGAVLNLYDELYKNADRITHVLTAHEQGASHAADGYARATGRTGVVLATSGPGATNLVTGIATHGPRQAIVRAIVDVCYHLGIVVVAEGVEEPEELAWLQSAGVTLIQGYVFARPVPLAEVERMAYGREIAA